MNRSLPAAAAAIAFALLLPGCSSGAGTHAARTPGPSASASRAAVPSFPGTAQPIGTRPASSPSATHSARTRYPAGWMLPDRKLSPGAIQPGYTVKDICPHVNPALEAMRPSTTEKALVYRTYGIFSHPAGRYEIDHVIPVELLGLVDAPRIWPAENLYPELNDTPDPAMLAKYHLSPGFVHNSKDVLEDVLHQKVCAGQVPLATAQHAIAADWRAAYARYVGQPPGFTPSPSPSRTHMSSAAPYPTHSRTIFSPAPAHAACRPKTSGGNCYRAGEFCRKSDLGTSGVAGNGERIRCEASGSRNRWEPA